jgi:hypothetical protein
MEETIIRPLLVRSDKIKYIIIPMKTPWEKGDLIAARRIKKDEIKIK